MDLCVQIAEHAEHLGEIRDDLARRKLLHPTLNSSSEQVSLSNRTRSNRTSDQPRVPNQYNGASLNIFQPPMNYSASKQNSSSNSIQQPEFTLHQGFVQSPPRTTAQSYVQPTMPRNQRNRSPYPRDSQTSGSGQDARSSGQIVCHGCKEPGHIRRNCPHLAGQPNPGPTFTSTPPSTSLQGPRTNVLKSDLSPTVEGKSVIVNNKSIIYTLDTGAEVTAISPGLYEELCKEGPIPLKKYHHPHACLANGGTAKILGSIIVNLSLGSFSCKATLIVIQDLAVDCLLGLDVIRSHPTMSRLLKRLENLRETNEPTSSDDIESENEERPEWTEKLSSHQMHSMSDRPAPESRLTQKRSQNRSSLAEIDNFHEGYWHLDELFSESMLQSMETARVRNSYKNRSAIEQEFSSNESDSDSMFVPSWITKSPPKLNLMRMMRPETTRRQDTKVPVSTKARPLLSSTLSTTRTSKALPSIGSTSLGPEPINASEKSEALIKLCPRSIPFASQMSAKQIPNRSKQQPPQLPNKLEWTYKPKRQYVAQSNMETDNELAPFQVQSSNHITQTLSPSTRCLKPKKVTFQDQFETEVSWHTPKREKVSKTGLKSINEVVDEGLLQWIPTPPNSDRCIFTKQTKLEEPIETRMDNCFGISLDEQQSEKRKSAETIPRSYVVEDWTVQTVPILYQDYPVIANDDHALVDIQNRIKGILEAVSATELFELRQTHAIEHKIVLTSDKIIKQRLRSVPHHYRQAFQELINEQIQAGFIQESNSPYCSPTHIVRKIDNTIRLTVDYRKINTITVPFPYPLPKISMILARLAKNRYFTKMDLFMSYYQIMVALESQKYTTFISEMGNYECIVMPMGLKNACATFQRLMDKVLDGLIGVTCFCYIDDIIVFSENIEEHMERVKHVADRLAEYNLRLKMKKCVIMVETIEFLGHEISFNSIRQSAKKVEAIAEAEPPKTVKQLRSFLGMAGYYRRFIKDFGSIAAPLFSATSSESKFIEWTPEMEEAFEVLKIRLTSTDNVLILPNFDKPFIVETDASDFGIGSALLQETDTIERPVAYFSKHLNKAEMNYSAREKEMLAIVRSLEHFSLYLYGKPFKIRTDHRPLSWMLTTERPASRIARWLVTLSGFEFTIEYKPGKVNLSADALSRLPNPADGDYNEPIIDKELVLNLMVFGDLKSSKSQRSDKYLSWIFDILEEKIECPVSNKKLNSIERKLFRILPKLVLEKGRLWYQQHTEGSRDRLLFMVPECDIIETTSSVHDSETG